MSENKIRLGVFLALGAVLIFIGAYQIGAANTATKLGKEHTEQIKQAKKDERKYAIWASCRTLNFAFHQLKLGYMDEGKCIGGFTTGAEALEEQYNKEQGGQSI